MRNDLQIIVVKRLPNNRWLALTCGLHFYSIPENYPVSDYKGYNRGWEGEGRFVSMISLSEDSKNLLRNFIMKMHTRLLQIINIFRKLNEL